MTRLILVRHGKSEWNHLGLWTGTTDVELAEEGLEEARRAGEALADIAIHAAYVSALKRAQQTLAELQQALKQSEIETTIHPALNERDYGVHTGKNKWQVKEELGEEEFQRVRRGWNVPIPNGETLKDVHDRVVPYFETHIKPRLQNGENTIIVAHGNTLRALIKHLEQLDEDQVCDVEVGTGEIHCYTLGPDGSVNSKEIRAANAGKHSV